MKRLLQFHRIAVFVFFLAGFYQAYAQTTISTNLVGSTTTTAGGVTFVVQNTNSSPIQLTDVGYYISTADNGQVYTLYYSSTSLSGAQPTVWPDPAWTLVGSQTVSGVTTSGIQNVLTNQTLVIPPNTTFRFSLLKAGSIPLYASSGGNTFSSGGVNLYIGNYQISGANVGYAYTITPRYWCGSVTFAPFGPCTSPPTPGVAVASNATPCLGQTVNLNLTGASLGSGQTYQWESATSLSGPWAPEGSSSSSAMITATPPVGTTYYRCMVTCGSSSVPSVADTVTVPTPYPGGIYTINSAVATGGTNFQTFAAAVAAISCGISGPVVFNVASGSGPYNEQINLPATIGADATNTVTFNGNGRTLTQTLTGTPTNYATINIDGADYITFNDLNIGALGATYGFGVHLMNGADHNTFKRCNVSASTTATGTTTACISMSGSAASYSTTGVNGSNNSFDSCTLTGGYFGFVGYGSGNASTMDSNNNLTNSLVKEFYIYGAYHYFNRSCSVSKSVFERPTRANASTGYGVYLSSCINMLVEKNKVRSLFGGALTTTNTSYPIFVAGDGTAGNENKVINNAVYNIEGNGIIGGIYLSGADYVQVYHNTVSLDYTSATAGTTYGIYSSGTVGGVDIKNNNISVTRGGSGLKYGLYFINSIHNSNNNNIYVKAPNGFLGYYNTDIPSLAAWQALTPSNPWDVNSVTNDPVFTDPATGNYAPLNSMINDLGIYVNVNDDINGAVRNVTTPDMGAYEFLPPACSGTPVAGTAAADKSNACINGLVTLSVTGFSTGSGIGIQWEEEIATNVWSAIPNATNSLHTATFALPTRYRAAVSCNAGTPVYSNVLTVGQSPSYLCYCSPNTGTPLHSTTANYITSVTIPGTTLNVTTSAIGIGGYTQHNPSVAANTATLTEAVTYVLNAGITSATYGTEMWIDWDQSGTFDASEYTLLTPGTTATASINVPLGVTPGMTGLRLRNYITTAFGANGACTNASTGRETEDFVITIVPNTNCTGTPSTAGTAAVDRDTLCVTGDVKLKLSGYPLNLGIDKNWQSSPAGANTFTDIPGANMDTFTAVGITSGTDFRARVTCTSPGGGTIYSNIKTITVNNPTLTSTIPGSRCSTGSVALYAQAAGTGVVNWYAAPTGGSVLATGNVFVTPSISATTSYYAAPGSGGATTQTSAMPPTLPNVSTTTNAGLLIDINTDLVLNSVNVFSINAGTVAVELRNSAGIIVAGPVSFPLVASTYTNPQTLTLNFPMPAGTGYRLLATPSAALAYQGGSYPLPLGNNVGNIVNGAVGTTTTSTLNYYFYNLKTSVGCEGTRTQVDATINPAGTGNLATGGTVVGNTQADGTTVSYDAPCADKLATVVDAAGGNVLGATSATVIVSPTIQTYNTKPYVARVHDITPASSGPATVTIYALQSEFNAYNSYVTTNSLSLPLMPTSAADPNASNIVVTQWHGSATAGKTGPGGLYGAAGATLIPNSAITKTSNGTYWTLTFPVTGFSGFFIHTGATPLTIQLASIAATNHGNRNRIDWMTTDEKEAAYFELESSTDAKSFERIGRENAKGKATNYSYWDEQPAKGMNYYRLKMYDKAGAFTYSDVVKAFVNGGDAFMVEAFPNPAVDVVNVRVNGVQGKDAKILVTDLAGKVIQTLTMSGANQMINVSGLANGVYMIKYVDSNHQQTLRVTKQ